MLYNHRQRSANDTTILQRRANVVMLSGYWRKNVQVNYLGGLPRNSVVKLTDRARNDLKCVEGP